MMDRKNIINLEELFPGVNAAAKKEDWLHFEKLSQDAAAKIAIHLGLDFIRGAFLDQPNVCQANAEGVLPEYRTAVTAREIFYYLIAVIEYKPVGSNIISYPTRLEEFWTLVEKGRSLISL